MLASLNRLAVVLLATATATLTAVSAYSGVLIVTNTEDSGPGSLRATLAAAASGDTVRFDDGLNGQMITLTSGTIAVGADIDGPGANQLIVKRSTAPNTPAFSVFTVNRLNSVRIAGLTIANGDAVQGGGIFSDAPSALTITNCAISGNHAQFGGGIFCNSQLGDIARFPTIVTITNSTISGNSAGSAAGIYVSGSHASISNYPCDVTITNSTISGNIATSKGGGIVVENVMGTFLMSSGLLRMTNTTITGNSANEGGGISYDGNSFPGQGARNTIIAQNTAPLGPDIKGAFVSKGFNIIGNNSGALISPVQDSDQIGTASSPTDPLLGPLQDNGGSTLTHALLQDSPAIDQGQSSDSTTDQRGFVRPVDLPDIPNAIGGDGADIGAVELTGAILVNISTRLRVEAGNNSMIGGFIITGTEPKTVIVRGLGPSLPLPGALADPTIEVHGASGELLATNDNWRDADSSQQILDSGLAPPYDLEAALWGIINPGSYTVILNGKNESTGIGLFEVYDLNQTENPRLGNISTRGFVGTDNEVLVSGTIIIGSHPTRVLVRAIGPSLISFGVPDALPDPTLELHNSDGSLLQSNDNWRDDHEAEIIATGIPPTNDMESAIVRDLSPGSYTAIVRGQNRSTGIGLVEVYDLN